MDAGFEKVLIEALDALESGEAVETILNRYPDYENELRPILLTTSSLAGMRVAHSLEAQAASRQRMLDYAAVTAVPPRRIVSPLLLLRRLSLAMAALLVIFGLLGSGVLLASSEAIPGDALYEAKLFFEDTRLSLTGDSAASEALRQQYEENRIREIETLLRMGRSEKVEFTGVIVAIEGDTWVVAGLETVILDSTMVTGAGAPAVGSLVQITGLTTNGRIHALAVVVRSIGSVPEPNPEDDSAKTPAPQPSPTNTPTPSPTATSTPTPTTTPTAEEGSSEAPPAQIATPTLESNENGNANGNENQGGGNSNENGEDSGGNNGGSNENDDDEDNENEHNENEHNENESNDNEGNENGHEEENGNESNDNENRNENKS